MNTSDSPRTFAWYVLHSFKGDGSNTYYDIDPNQVYGNAPSPSVHLENFQKIGLLDEIPTYDNMIPLLKMYNDWYKDVDKDWNVYVKEEKNKGLLVTLHWTLSNILVDVNIDPRILHYVVENHPNRNIWVVYNGKCPEDILRNLIENAGSKKDSTKETKGGEITVFILYNKQVSSEIVDLCVKKTKKSTVQKIALDHPNISRETLVFLSKNGKSESVKKNSLRLLVTKGFLEVK